MRAKSSKPPRIFQWDAIDASADLWDQNVLRTFEMAIRHKRRATGTELESFLSLDSFSLTFKFFFGPSPPLGGAA